MESILLGTSSLRSSRLIYGCMRIAGDGTAESRARGRSALLAAYEAGYTHFDHANIYGAGECESIHGELMREESGLRERSLIASKCGIRLAGKPLPDDPSRYDFSREHILSEVEGSLRRLQTDRLDLLLLHRPDYLFHPDEVAEAFTKLREAGKVLYFGVSNFRASQVSLLQSRLDFPLVCHQLELNLHHIAPLENGLLDQCLEKAMTPTAWCPLGAVAYPAWGSSLTKEDEDRLANELKGQSVAYSAEPELIALAWILGLPSKVAPIIGSTTPERIRQAVEALGINYRREDFYRLLEARNGRRVP
jgi:predicted oxidoreductase